MVRAVDCPLPEQGMAASAVIDELAATAEPGLNGMVGARFFGWVLGGSHPLGVAADWLTSTWGQNCGNHHAAPSAEAFEEVAGNWLLDILDLPRECSVGFVTGATIANFVCLAAARHALLTAEEWNVEAQGLFGAPPINVLVGDDAHATVFKALGFLGLGSERVIRLATDAAGRILIPSFQEALEACTGPTVVIAQAGQINPGASDPFQDIAAACRRWLHVDGAFGLWARASSDQADLTEGVDGADSPRRDIGQTAWRSGKGQPSPTRHGSRRMATRGRVRLPPLPPAQDGLRDIRRKVAPPERRPWRCQSPNSSAWPTFVQGVELFRPRSGGSHHGASGTRRSA